MAAVQPDEPSANVRFTTRLEPSLRVTEAPIQLPVRLTRYGLSEVVNHLLGAAPPRPFDFLLQGELLRGSLGKAMARLALSGEEAVTLEYIELLAPPQPQAHPRGFKKPKVQDGSRARDVSIGCVRVGTELVMVDGDLESTPEGRQAAEKVRGIDLLQYADAATQAKADAKKAEDARVLAEGANLLPFRSEKAINGQVKTGTRIFLLKGNSVFLPSVPLIVPKD